MMSVSESGGETVLDEVEQVLLSPKGCRDRHVNLYHK
jgi:hypothetical protein